MMTFLDYVYPKLDGGALRESVTYVSKTSVPIPFLIICSRRTIITTEFLSSYKSISMAAPRH